jgi:predicted secreted protein
MSTSKIILRNRHGAEVATIFFDEDSRRWRIVSKAEPKFKRNFSTQKEAFDVWHANFHTGTGKLRKWR